MTIALARRYRPKKFADLLVQDHVTAVLRGAVARGRVGHGYLLTGPRGVGKTTAARILAMALNCPRRDPSGDPCGECENCLRVWNGSANLDVVEIDAASNRGVDDARDLRERAMYAASQEAHHKVYIVDEAHMLTREAWNALLKILEEPPPRVVFVFATTEPHKIAATAAPVLSRLQRFDFRRIGTAAIRERLRTVLNAEGIAADDDALTLIARHADGGMRDALSVLDQCLSFGEGAITAARVRDILGLVGDELYGELLNLVARRDAAGIFPLVDRLLDAGHDLGEFTNGAAEMLRALLMLQVGAEPDGLTEPMRRTLDVHRSSLEAGDVLRMLRLLADGEAGIRRSANVRLAVETLLLRWTLMDRIVDLERVLAGAEGGEGEAEGRDPDHFLAPDPSVPADSPVALARPVSVNPPVTLSLDGLRSGWAHVVAAGRAASPFLGEALAAASPTAVEPPFVTIALPEPNPVHAITLERQRDRLDSLLSAIVGGASVRVRLTSSPPSEAAPAARPQRVSDAGIRADRLKGLRAKDPALDAAVDELDLEIVD